MWNRWKGIQQRLPRTVRPCGRKGPRKLPGAADAGAGT